MVLSALWIVVLCVWVCKLARNKVARFFGVFSLCMGIMHLIFVVFHW